MGSRKEAFDNTLRRMVDHQKQYSGRGESRTELSAMKEKLSSIAQTAHVHMEEAARIKESKG